MKLSLKKECIILSLLHMCYLDVFWYMFNEFLAEIYNTWDMAQWMQILVYRAYITRLCCYNYWGHYRAEKEWSPSEITFRNIWKEMWTADTCLWRSMSGSMDILCSLKLWGSWFYEILSWAWILAKYPWPGVSGSSCPHPGHSSKKTLQPALIYSDPPYLLDASCSTVSSASPDWDGQTPAPPAAGGFCPCVDPRWEWVFKGWRRGEVRGSR